MMICTKGNIVAKLVENRIVVEDEIEGHKYVVNADANGINELGKETPTTWREAIRSGRLIIQNDDLDGHSWGQHGSIFIAEE